VDIIGVGISLLVFIIPSAARAKLVYKLSCIKEEDREKAGLSYSEV
jgi:hypothetical protein